MVVPPAPIRLFRHDHPGIPTVALVLRDGYRIFIDPIFVQCDQAVWLFVLATVIAHQEWAGWDVDHLRAVAFVCLGFYHCANAPGFIRQADAKEDGSPHETRIETR